MALVSSAACNTPRQPQAPIVAVKSENKTVVEFNGKCAMAVADGFLDRLGHSEYKVEQDGKTYYFSSPEARDQFMSDFDKNKKAAQHNWAVARAETHS
jgi:YHS domain-containing protein